MPQAKLAAKEGLPHLGKNPDMREFLADPWKTFR
jgi:hypothetical protein